MNPSSYNAIVVGLGAVGSAAVYHLVQRGQRVLGLDRFAPPHTLGSTHGGSRIIRKAYFEGDYYVPLIERAYTLWQELEAASGQSMLHITGGLNIGPVDGYVAKGAEATAEAYGLAYERLSAAETQARFPAFRVPDDHACIWESDAGWLHPEACIQAHLDQARRHGAALHNEELVISWHIDGSGVQVTTTKATYRADRLVLCAGGWIKDLLSKLEAVLVIERQVNGWFHPRANAAHLDPAHCPIYLWEYAPGTLLYGFPNLGRGVKAGIHHQGERVPHPDDLQRTPTDADLTALRDVLGRLLPDAVGVLADAATCFYTDTPDEHYLIDRHPVHTQVVYASACSGHGFKASNAIGEVLADMALEQTPHVNIDAFRWRW